MASNDRTESRSPEGTGPNLRVNAAARSSTDAIYALADAMPQMVWVARADGHLEYFNHRWWDYTGLSPNGLSNDDWIEALHPEDRAPAATAWKRALGTGEQYDVQYRLWNQSGRAYRWFLARGLPTRDNGKIIRWFGTCTDIHDLKTAELELKQAKEDSERDGRTKDQFLSIISHDLRTPLSAILGWTQLLEMDVLDENERREAVETIKQQAKAQSQLIEDLLDVSRIINGKFHLRPQNIEITRVLANAMQAVQPIATSNGVMLERGEWSSDEVVIQADPQRLQQAVTILLHNAVKFTPKDGRVAISVNKRDGTLCVTVRDHGAGIPVEQITAIFDRFKEAGGSAISDKGGLGLGLSIVKHVIDAHGGTICARTDGAEGGSFFELILPTLAGPAERAQAAESAGPAELEKRADLAELQGIRVLVVDDEDSARVVISSALRKAGCDVVGARDVAEAWKLLNIRPFDVLVSDLGLIGESGLDLIARIRAADLPFFNIPALALTGFASVDDQTRALAAGFQMHTAKPFEAKELVRQVASLANKMK